MGLLDYAAGLLNEPYRGMLKRQFQDLDGIEEHPPQPRPFGWGDAVPSTQPPADWSRLNQPFGELSVPAYTPSQRIGNVARDVLMALGASPYDANHLTRGVGNILGLTPLAVPAAAADAIDAKHRGDDIGLVEAMVAMTPGAGRGVRGVVREAGPALRQLAMDVESRWSRAKDAGFHTNMPLYHGTGATFDEFRAVPTSAGVRDTPGVSLALDPAIANEFALKTAGSAQANPQVHKLFHRAEKPVALTLSGDEGHAEVVATLQDAFDRGHDAVMLRNYTSPGSNNGTIIIVKDANQLRSVNAAFDPAKRNERNLLYSAAPLAPIGAAASGAVFAPVDHDRFAQ